MKLIFLATSLFSAPLAWANSNATWKLAPVSSQQKITATSPGSLEKFETAPIRLRAARGEWENFQFVVTAGQKRIENLEISPRGLASISGDVFSSKNFEIYRENYVFVAHPSGNQVLSPKWWPDALIPLKLAPKSVEARRSAVFWGSLKIPIDATPGDYFGEIEVLSDGAPRRLALWLSIETVSRPNPAFRAAVALYYDALRDWYSKAGHIFSEEEWTLQKKRYYDFLLDYGLNAYDLPVAWNSPEIEIYLRNPRVLSVRMPPLDSSDFSLALDKFKATGTLSKAFYYWIDEPDSSQFELVRQTTEKLRVLGVKHLVTAHPNDALKDAVDIWCPNLGDYFGIGHLDEKNLETERKAGREAWVYTMVVPKFPAPTWLLDDEATSILAFAPLWARYGFSGFVYSMCHGWGPKPLENLESYEGTHGDGTLLYPAEIVGGIGPIPSIRLMLLRDAIENFELKRFPPAPSKIIEKRLQARGKTVIWREGAPKTRVSWRFDAKNQTIHVRFRAKQPQDGDYLAVEIAPQNIEARPEKWRFIMTLKGTVFAEKRTRDGLVKLKTDAFRAQIAVKKRFYRVEMTIPLAVLGEKNAFLFDEFRFDALRRTRVNGAKITIYAFSGTGDPAFMPIFGSTTPNSSKTELQPLKPFSRAKI